MKPTVVGTSSHVNICVLCTFQIIFADNYYIMFIYFASDVIQSKSKKLSFQFFFHFTFFIM